MNHEYAGIKTHTGYCKHNDSKNSKHRSRKEKNSHRDSNKNSEHLGEGVNSPNDNGNYRPLGVLHFGLAVRPAIIASRGDIRCSC